MLQKYALFTTGLAFLAAWLVVVAIAWSFNDETPLLWLYSIIILPIAQVEMFTVYRLNRQKLFIGGWFLAVIGVSLAVNFLVGNAGFFGFFMALSFASAVLHTFYGFLVNEERKTVKPRGGAPISQQR